MARYKQYVGNGMCIVVSSYAGKTVKGVSKVAPNDEFDLEKGLALAKARCDQKVAVKRCKRADKKLAEAKALFYAAKEYYERMADYYSDSADDLVEANQTVEKLLADM